ncbi:hypothetical protein TELCIR_05471 [Teladorsagia circumcincta]|uniref:BOS complex subunit NCLN n=1 Tax=Teladorsagia circumcincta TaxID=45464 RepID=A0A2G9USU5_TELCI|nr:hypothetical protein TELCIR_05471 [Teladorsagia circumcincta]
METTVGALLIIIPSDLDALSPADKTGRLSSSERSAPTIAFVAHYDSHAVFPGVAVGADSNGSGVVVLLELLAIFRKLYEKPSTRPPFNLVGYTDQFHCIYDCGIRVDSSRKIQLSRRKAVYRGFSK